MPDEELEALWRDPQHWTRLGIYRCEQDPRVWVRKRDPGIGWTLNFAHRSAWAWIGALIVPPLGLVTVGISQGRARSPLLLPVTIGVTIALVIGIGIWVSIRDS